MSCRLGQRGVLSRAILHTRQHTLDARSVAASGEVSKGTLAVNPRDGMVYPGSLPTGGIKLKRVYI
jgi:hypothetical protein